MKVCLALAVAVLATFSCASCTMHEKKVEQELKHYPINCATAEGDIRALEHEKAHVAQEIAAGVSAVVPMAAVVGLVTGTEGEDFKVATGEYNKMIDKKIAEIRAKCGR
jgi:hypothetical protein